MFMIVLYIIVFYLLGSLSFGYIVSRCFGLVDPREVGSGSRGATNVLRASKRGLPALLTLLGDAFKGYLPLLVVMHYSAMPSFILSLLAIVLVLGHIFPIFFDFKGGKGVATTVGVLWALDWHVGLSVAVLWLVVLVFTRISSAAALIGVVLGGPVFMYIYQSGPSVYFWTSCVLSLVVLGAHYQNIHRLMQGKEAAIRLKQDGD